MAFPLFLPLSGSSRLFSQAMAGLGKGKDKTKICNRDRDERELEWKDVAVVTMVFSPVYPYLSLLPLVSFSSPYHELARGRC